MKRMIALFGMIVLLCGCSGTHQELDAAMELRSRLLASGTSFAAEVTADYGKEVYQFTLQCETDEKGTLHFSVVQPDSISGISGKVAAEGGAIVFDEEALSFPILADGQISPVAAPWVFIHSLRSGYLTSCGREGDGIRVAIDDSYADDALHLDVWLDEQENPVRAEIFWKGRRVLSVAVKNFCFL